MAEVTAYLTKLQPNGVVIGKRSFGATCTIKQLYNLTYSGSFGSSRLGYTVYTAFQYVSPIDGSELEGVGVEPDIEMNAGFTNQDEDWAWDHGGFSQLHDLQLEKAVETIQNYTH